MTEVPMVYGLYRNTEPCEGKGTMVLDALFESREDAEEMRRSKKDYLNWPMWEVRALYLVPKKKRPKYVIVFTYENGTTEESEGDYTYEQAEEHARHFNAIVHTVTAHVEEREA